MRVVLDTTFGLRGPSGTAVYLEHLITALRNTGIDVVEEADLRRGRPGGGRRRSARNLAEDVRWTTLELPARAQRVNADVLHHPLPAVAPRCAVPQVITVHDLAFERLPDHFDPRWRAWARITHRLAARDAAAVVCVSEATARDVCERWGIDPSKVVVAPHGPGQELPDRPRTPTPEHFLYVGDDEPRKGLAVLRDAHSRYLDPPTHDLPLVIAGAAGGQRAPDELAQLYAGAAALVHPSLWEGFGLTPLEALRAGVPVIAAPVGGVGEVCGDALLPIDPTDPGDIARAMRRIAEDPGLREQLSARGRNRAAEFTWARSAQHHAAAYTLAAGQR